MHWKQEGNDVGNKQLNLDEFRVACLTLTSAYARESLSNEQIETDFNNLDTNCNGSIGFVEVFQLIKLMTEILP